MFMDRNRKINGAADPGKTVSADASVQRRARKLSPNGPIPSDPEDWRFNPTMDTCARINEDHYMAGLGSQHPYDADYEKSVPSVGLNPADESGDRKLKDR